MREGSLVNESFEGLPTREESGSPGPESIGRPLFESDGNTRVTKSYRLDRMGRVEATGETLNFSDKKAYRLGQVNFMPDDAAYLDAANRGDMETAQRMVDEAAKAAGYTVGPVLHGTDRQFNKFSKLKGGRISDARSAKLAFFFTDDPLTAQAYGVHAAEEGPIQSLLKKADKAEKRQDWAEYEKAIAEAEAIDTPTARLDRRGNVRVIKGYLKGNFAEVDAEGKTPAELASGDLDAGITREIVKAKREGKEGVKFINLDDAVGIYDKPSNHYAIFKPNQIKSADPVTYDDQGNVIPLSERFQGGSDDIRFMPAEDAGGFSPTQREHARELWGSMQESSPYFKDWFGDWEGIDAKRDVRVVDVPSSASISVGDAKAWARRNLQGKILANEDSGISYRVSRNSLEKMLAGGKDNPQARAAGIRSLPELVKHAIDVVVRPDDGSDATVRLIHEMYVPMRFKDQLYQVRLLGKEFFDKANKLHSYRIDGMKIEKPTGTLQLAHPSRGGMAAPAAGWVNLGQLLSGVNLGDVSKVVTPEGIPRVVYHGTPDAGFSVFRENTHFTENPEYASLYSNPSASSLGGMGKAGDAPGVYPVYLSIKKPFDTRKPREANLYAEFTSTYGNNTPLSERGLPDWTDSLNLIEWIKETGLDYDGLILDEGGTPEGGWRRVSYVPMKASQVKSAYNQGTFGNKSNDIRFLPAEPLPAGQLHRNQLGYTLLETQRGTWRVYAPEGELLGVAKQKAEAERIFKTKHRRELRKKPKARFMPAGPASPWTLTKTQFAKSEGVLHHQSQSPDLITELRPKSYGTAGVHEYYYFSDSPKVLERMIKAGASKDVSPVKQTVSAHVDVRNPLKLDPHTPKEWVTFLEGENIRIPDALMAKLNKVIDWRREITPWELIRFDTGELRGEFIRAGYDGLTYTEWGANTTVAFDVSQITTHRQYVEQALAAGKYVPQKALKDYADKQELSELRKKPKAK